MAPRAERILVVSFGPAATPVLATALAFSRTHASSVEPGGPGGYRAAFLLDNDPEAYGRAEQLTRMSFGWKANPRRRSARTASGPARIETSTCRSDLPECWTELVTISETTTARSIRASGGIRPPRGASDRLASPGARGSSGKLRSISVLRPPWGVPMASPLVGFPIRPCGQPVAPGDGC